MAVAEPLGCLCGEGTVWPHPFGSPRKKKKILKEQRKQRERVELKMDLPGVSIADDGDTSMFSLRSIHRSPVGGDSSRGHRGGTGPGVSLVSLV